MKKIIYLLLVAVFCICRTASAQLTDGFHLYVFENRYDNNDYFRQNNLFKFYKILGQTNIDPQNQGIVDDQKIYAQLTKLFPNASDEGVLSIDLENDLFKSIQNSTPGNSNFENAQQQFIHLITIVRKFRPNVKIGFYGMPYRTFYANQMSWNANRKLDKILSLCDFISPSLYILFPDKEIGSASNEKYLGQNLQIALEYGKRLNKPVIPYMWYMVNPGNRKYGGEIMDKSEMLSHINFVRNYSVGNTRVNGIFWWESSDAGFNKYAKVPKSFENVDKGSIKNKIVYDYTRSLTQ